MIQWCNDWQPFDLPELEVELLAELERETGAANPTHPLHGKRCRVVGWRVNPLRARPTPSQGLKACKDLLLHVPQEGRYAFVHLTWTRETRPQWPNCWLFASVKDLNAFLQE
ncbi:MAG TPA: hypothetical protein VF796_28785 [Humisphaera sp.]